MTKFLFDVAIKVIIDVKYNRLHLWVTKVAIVPVIDGDDHFMREERKKKEILIKIIIIKFIIINTIDIGTIIYVVIEW